MLDDGGMRNYGWDKLGVGIRQHRQPLPQASGNTGFSNTRAVVALKAQALKMWRSRSVRDQTGRKAGRIYQTTNGQRIESIFWLMPNDCVACLRKMKYWWYLGSVKDFLLSPKLKHFWFVWSSGEKKKYHGHIWKWGKLEWKKKKRRAKIFFLFSKLWPAFLCETLSQICLKKFLSKKKTTITTSLALAQTFFLASHHKYIIRTAFPSDTSLSVKQALILKSHSVWLSTPWTWDWSVVSPAKGTTSASVGGCFWGQITETSQEQRRHSWAGL